MRRLAYFITLCALASPAWADVSASGGIIGSGEEGKRIKTVTVTTNTDSAGDFGSRREVLGFKLNPTAAFAHCALFDAATVTGTAIDEITEASADETSFQLWPTPYVLTTDLSISVGNGSCTVYYR